MPSNSAAIAIAVIAEQQAHEAKIIACKSSMQDFKHTSSTIQQQKQYADCVNEIYPQNISGNELIAIKFAIVILLLSLPIGAWWGWKENERVTDSFMWALLGSCITGTFLLIGWLIYLGIQVLAM